MNDEVRDYQENYESGWISVYRSLINNKLWTAEKFTKGQAWVDLLLLAKYKDGLFMQREVIVNYKRGDVTEGIVNLAKRWKWSRNKTQNYINYLETIQQVKQQKSTVITIISILNYSIYQKTIQQNEQQEDSKRTARGQQEDTHNKDNKDNKDNNIYISENNFEKFWQIYPKRNGKLVGKKECVVWFKNNVKSDDLYNRIITGTNNYAKSRSAMDNYAVDPIRFLKRGNYDDWQTPEIINLDRNETIKGAKVSYI